MIIASFPVVRLLAKFGHPCSSLTFSRSFLPPFSFAPLVCPQSLAAPSRPCGLTAVASVAVFWGRVLPTFDSAAYVLRYRSALPSSGFVVAPLPPPAWLTPALWLLSMWLLSANRVAPRFGRSPCLTHLRQVAHRSSASAFCFKICIVFNY